MQHDITPSSRLIEVTLEGFCVLPLHYCCDSSVSMVVPVVQEKLSTDYTQKDAILELLDNSLEACYDSSLKGKRRCIFLTYGPIDGRGKALEIFDGGIGMGGMGDGGIAAWATLVRQPSSAMAASYETSVNLQEAGTCVSDSIHERTLSQGCFARL